MDDIIEINGMDTVQVYEDIKWLTKNIPKDSWNVELSDQWFAGKMKVRISDPEYMLLARLRFTR